MLFSNFFSRYQPVSSKNFKSFQNYTMFSKKKKKKLLFFNNLLNRCFIFIGQDKNNLLARGSLTNTF